MLEIRPAADRFCTRTDWLTSWHSFSYGEWYDPDNVAFGALTVLNHDVLAPGAGFDSHRHSGHDLVTYVVAGALEHQDSLGHKGAVRAGQAQLLRSGSGVTHSERNASTTEPVEYVQMWVRSSGNEVAYVIPAASEDDTVAVAEAGRLSLRRLDADHGWHIGAPWLHAYVLEGSPRVGDQQLGPGDAVRATGDPVLLEASGPATLLVWQLH